MEAKKSDLEQQKVEHQKVVDDLKTAKENIVSMFVQGKRLQVDVERVRVELKKAEDIIGNLDELIEATNLAIKKTDGSMVDLIENVRMAERTYYTDLYEKSKNEIRELVGDRVRRAFTYSRFGAKHFTSDNEFFYRDIFGKCQPDQNETQKYIEEHNK
jgi:hypothetical protein